MNLIPSDCSIEIPKEEFDRLVRTSQFEVGPFKEQTSDGYGMPYVARKHYKIFGQLKDGRKVWAWRYPEERVDEA